MLFIWTLDLGNLTWATLESWVPYPLLFFCSCHFSPFSPHRLMIYTCLRIITNSDHSLYFISHESIILNTYSFNLRICVWLYAFMGTACVKVSANFRGGYHISQKWSFRHLEALWCGCWEMKGFNVYNCMCVLFFLSLCVCVSVCM